MMKINALMQDVTMMKHEYETAWLAIVQWVVGSVAPMEHVAVTHMSYMMQHQTVHSVGYD